ncbi:MAG: RtcB family protein [Synergistaceae bacterium]|jgi:RNA-splicing ligase RtcB|nr:RtcB family protein [Synergistaceae bacterium]
MIEIKGRFNSAIAYVEELDEEVVTQIRTLCDQSFVEGSVIRIMPDAHFGKGCTIGTTMTLTDRVVPNLVGVDIGCGMETARIREREIDCARLDETIRRTIPSGSAIRKAPHPCADEARPEDLRCAHAVSLERARRSIGTLGGGNHFIEVDRDDEGNLYVVVHSGSRHMGLEVAEFYQQAAWERLNQNSFEHRKALIDEYKRQGRDKEISGALADLKKQVLTNVPSELAYVEGKLFEDYIHDMTLAQRFAALNRRVMVQQILEQMGLTAVEQFTTIHNTIDTGQDIEETVRPKNMILRKGAVSARRGEKLLIPMNMRDGSLICIGRGNPDWNFSAPHGAGRLMSRSQARSQLSLSEYQASMKGVFSTSVDRATLDEAPMAYKPMESILAQTGDTVTVERRIVPIYNFKAS